MLPGRAYVLRSGAAQPFGPAPADPPGPVLAVRDGVPTLADAAGWTANVVVRRPGTSGDPLRHGERFGLRVDPAGQGSGGWLIAGPPGGGPVVAVSRPPEDDAPGTCAADPWWAQWEVTGAGAGAGVGTDRPVGLFDVVEGDHLVLDEAAADDPAGALSWWSRAGEAGVLPVPATLRPADALAGEVEVHGALVPVGQGGGEAALLLLDRPVARVLGGHLGRRLPGGAAALAPEGVVASLACRWPTQVDPSLLPAPGTRVWVRGVLVAAPGLTVTAVRGMAWARTVAGDPLAAAPGEAGWPEDVVVWRVLTWGPGGPAGSGAGRVADRVAGRAAESLAWALPLPGRDGERGSATTFTRLRETVLAGSRDGSSRPRRPAAVVPPTIVRDARSGRRALRLVGSAASAAPGLAPALDGVTVRVHLRD